jgi:hypothetical protein
MKIGNRKKTYSKITTKTTTSKIAAKNNNVWKKNKMRDKKWETNGIIKQANLPTRALKLIVLFFAG